MREPVTRRGFLGTTSAALPQILKLSWALGSMILCVVDWGLLRSTGAAEMIGCLPMNSQPHYLAIRETIYSFLAPTETPP